MKKLEWILQMQKKGKKETSTDFVSFLLEEMDVNNCFREDIRVYTVCLPFLLHKRRLKFINYLTSNLEKWSRALS